VDPAEEIVSVKDLPPNRRVRGDPALNTTLPPARVAGEKHDEPVAGCQRNGGGKKSVGSGCRSGPRWLHS